MLRRYSTAESAIWDAPCSARSWLVVAVAFVRNVLNAAITIAISVMLTSDSSRTNPSALRPPLIRRRKARTNR